MPDEPNLGNVPQATVVPRSRARISVVWIIPILAAVVAIGIAVQRILSEGPTVRIVFKAAQGVEANKTFLKYKDVNIGQVTAVQLTPDYTHVEVTAKIQKSAAGLMVEDARFFVVEPRVTLSGVSGLGTLLSGNYIGFEVGKSKKKETKFVGLETPPVITGDQPGKEFKLTANSIGSLGIGSPVYYRRLRAGQVTAYTLASDGKSIDLRVFINEPYDKYVTEATRFWNASGIDVSLSASGLQVQTESLVSLIAGGVAFDTSAFVTGTGPVAAETTFTLFNDRTTAMKQPEKAAGRFVLYFKESLRGLSPGAPVTLLGLPAGEVTDVGLDIEPKTKALRGRVDVVTYPERLIERLSAGQAVEGAALAKSVAERHALFQRLVEHRGLRAQLKSGNLITGQLYVAMDFYPDAPKAQINWSQDPTVLPTVPSTIPDLEAKVSSILAKLDQLPYDQIGTDVSKVLATLDGTLKDVNTTLGAINSDVTPGLRKTLDDLQSVIATADDVLKKGVNETLSQVNATLEDLRKPLAAADVALRNADVVLKNADATILGRDAPVQQDLRDALQEITLAARSLRTLMDYLERHPESLIRGKTKQENP